MLTPQVWQYLEQVWREGEETTGEPRAAIVSIWPDRHKAARELFFAIEHVSKCEEDEAAVHELIESSEPFLVGGLPFCLQAMRKVLDDGLRAISAETLDVTQGLLSDADLTRKADIALTWGNLGKTGSRCLPDLVGFLDSREKTVEQHALRCAAAFAIGKIGVVTDAAIDVLSRVAQAANEPQSLRSYCIETLMDLGPGAASATPILESIFQNESEDEDLRQFAWGALKSVTAGSAEHPCGGTVAEHIRSLYTTVSQPEQSE